MKKVNIKKNQELKPSDKYLSIEELEATGQKQWVSQGWNPFKGDL